MSFEEMLKNLQRDYLHSLPEKISTIQEQIQGGDVVVLRASFHKLKGTGKTYGIPEISELAAELEDICQGRPAVAAPAAREAVLILRDIHSARKSNHEFKLASDPRFKKIRAL